MLPESIDQPNCFFTQPSFVFVKWTRIHIPSVAAHSCVSFSLRNTYNIIHAEWLQHAKDNKNKKVTVMESESDFIVIVCELSMKLTATLCLLQNTEERS